MRLGPEAYNHSMRVYYWAKSHLHVHWDAKAFTHLKTRGKSTSSPTSRRFLAKTSTRRAIRSKTTVFIINIHSTAFLKLWPWPCTTGRLVADAAQPSRASGSHQLTTLDTNQSHVGRLKLQIVSLVSSRLNDKVMPVRLRGWQRAAGPIAVCGLSTARQPIKGGFYLTASPLSPGQT